MAFKLTKGKAAIVVGLVAILFIGAYFGGLLSTLSPQPQLDTSLHIQTFDNLQWVGGVYGLQATVGGATGTPANGNIIDSPGYLTSFNLGVQSTPINVAFVFLPDCQLGIVHNRVGQYKYVVLTTSDFASTKTVSDSGWTEQTALDSIQYGTMGASCGEASFSNPYQFFFTGPFNGYMRVELWVQDLRGTSLLAYSEVAYQDAYVSTQTGTFVSPVPGTVYHPGDTIPVQVSVGQECLSTYNQPSVTNSNGVGWLLVITSGANPTGLDVQLGCGPNPGQPVQTLSYSYVVQAGDLQTGGTACLEGNPITFQLFTQYIQHDKVATLTAKVGATQPAPPHINVSANSVYTNQEVTITLSPGGQVPAGATVSYVLQIRYSDGTIVPTPAYLNTTTFTFGAPKAGTITVTANVIVDCVPSNPNTVTVQVLNQGGPNCQTNPTDPACPHPGGGVALWIWLLVVGIVLLVVAVLIRNAISVPRWVLWALVVLGAALVAIAIVLAGGLV